MTHKWLKPKMNIVPCEECGNAKLLHHLCVHCYSFNKWTAKKDALPPKPKDLDNYQELLDKYNITEEGDENKLLKKLSRRRRRSTR